MLEAGFGRGDSALKLGQLGEALVRLARFVVGIRLHTDDWSVEQGVRFFREEAFLEEASARREAERGTFDPTYIVYSVGKLMLLKLRHDWQEEAARQDHAAGLPRRVPGAGVGAVPGTPPAHARTTPPATSWSNARMPLYEYQCDACGHRFEVIQKYLGRPDRGVPEVRRGRPEAALVAGDSVQGLGLVHHRLRARGQDPTAGAGGRAKAESNAVGPRADASARRQVEGRNEGRDEGPRPKTDAKAETQGRRRKPRASLAPRRGQIERLEVLAERAGQLRAASVRSRPPPSGTRACCRCRGGRRRFRRHTAAVTPAAASCRW